MTTYTMPARLLDFLVKPMLGNNACVVVADSGELQADERAIEASSYVASRLEQFAKKPEPKSFAVEETWKSRLPMKWLAWQLRRAKTSEQREVVFEAMIARYLSRDQADGDILLSAVQHLTELIAANYKNGFDSWRNHLSLLLLQSRQTDFASALLDIAGGFNLSRSYLIKYAALPEVRDRLFTEIQTPSILSTTGPDYAGRLTELVCLATAGEDDDILLKIGEQVFREANGSCGTCGGAGYKIHRGHMMASVGGGGGIMGGGRSACDRCKRTGKNLNAIALLMVIEEKLALKPPWL